MINLDYQTLNIFFEENIDFFIGARLQKIQQPTRRDFIFSLRNHGESRKLYININPRIYHITFMSKEGEFTRNFVIPKHPPMFCMLLRKYLEGTIIDDAKVVENERILEFFFEITDELAQKRDLCLSIELMGKHSNVILYDRETSLIIGCAHNVGSEKSRYRELKGGLKYIYPPKVNDRAKIITPLYKDLQGKYNTSVSVSRMLDEYFSKLQEEINIREKKRNLYALVQPKLNKVEGSINKITNLLNKRNNAEKYKLYGELLTANIYKNANYQNQIELFDYYNNKNIIIELDTAKSLKENAQRYFKLYTKSKTTKEKSEIMLNNLQMQKEYLENVLYSIETAVSINELKEIEQELSVTDEKSEKNKKQELLTLSINGFEVYVGRNNKQNDYIISKLAKDDDYWFHTKLCAGSHVLLKVNTSEPDELTIYECCKLAREYSSAKQPSKVGVIYTKAKFLRKPPASPPGYVTYKNEKEILI